MDPNRMSVDDIMKKYGSKIEKNIQTSPNPANQNYSREYVKFKQEMIPEISKYERWCKSLGSLIKLNVSKKDEEKIRRQLEIAH